MNIKKPILNVYLANPRGFCAGVDRAVQIVENTLKKYGSPVYVRHEIVHNKHVVQQLATKGAVFINDLQQITDNTRPIIFSAHGVPKNVPLYAEKNNLFYIDATCPLVSKVHHEAKNYAKNNYHILLIGHKGHPEVIGTMGQIPNHTITLIETIHDANHVKLPKGKKAALITQTTLSLDDTAEISTILCQRFPDITKPPREDICYATTNRQLAVKKISKKCDAVLIIGAQNSSNSVRLVEVAKKAGVNFVQLITDETEIPMQKIAQIKNLGISAGASAPEILVQHILDNLRHHYQIIENNIEIAQENIKFKLPHIIA